ncbi:UNVERIFIED_CONTAM: hypothetical protein FKN15_049937 [Acipenser sinensis]
MAQVLELLAKQALVVPAPLQPQLPYPPSPRGDQGGWEEASQLMQEDTLSIAASGDRASFSSDMQVGGELEPPAKEEPGRGSLRSQCSPIVQLSFDTDGTYCSLRAVPWTPVAEQHRSVFQTQEMAPRHQKFLAFPDLEGVEKLGLAGLPPVDSTITALVKALLVGGECPNPQCKVTEMHFKQAYAAEAQATCLSNTASVITAYMDGVLHEVPLPEPAPLSYVSCPACCCRSPVSKGKLLARAWLA